MEALSEYPSRRRDREEVQESHSTKTTQFTHSLLSYPFSKSLLFNSNADKCTFEQTGDDQTVYQYQLSTGAYNCGGSTEDQTTTATITDSVTNSWTVGGGAGVSADGGEEIPVGVSAKISVTYGGGSTEAHSLSKMVTAKPNSSQYYIQQKQFTRHNGRIRVNYGHTVGGHYIWYLNGSKNDVETGDVVSVSTKQVSIRLS